MLIEPKTTFLGLPLTKKYMNRAKKGFWNVINNNQIEMHISICINLIMKKSFRITLGQYVRVRAPNFQYEVEVCTLAFHGLECVTIQSVPYYIIVWFEFCYIPLNNFLFTGEVFCLHMYVTCGVFFFIHNTGNIPVNKFLLITFTYKTIVCKSWSV